MKKLKAFLVLIALTALPQQLLAEPHQAPLGVKADVKTGITKPSNSSSKAAKVVSLARNAPETVRKNTKRSEIQARLNKKIASLNAKKAALQQELRTKQAQLTTIEQQIEETNEKL